MPNYKENLKVRKYIGGIYDWKEIKRLSVITIFYDNNE